MNLDEALTYQALQHAYKPKSCPRWEAGLEAEQAMRRKLYYIFYHRQAGRAALGLSSHSALSAGKREGMKKLEPYSFEQKYHVLCDGVLGEPQPRRQHRHSCTTINDSMGCDVKCSRFR